MTGAAWLLLTLLLIWGGVAALRRRLEAGAAAGRRVQGRQAAPPGDDDEIDRGMLEQAEHEARDMGSDERGAPLDDEAGNDWGPGTARNPWGHGG